MPIRFRCVYCNQLLGISRRKAGTIVRCTSCEGQLIVPDPGEAGIHVPGEAEKVEASLDQPAKVEEPARNPDLFSVADFDAFLEPPGAAGGAVVSPPAPLIQQSTTVTEKPPVVLSRRTAVLAVVVTVVAVCGSFAAGLCLGLWLH